MVTKTAHKAAPAKPVAKPVQKAEKPASKVIEVNWDELPEEEEVVYTRGEGISRIDIEAETPNFVKDRLVRSYNAYMKPWATGVDSQDQDRARAADKKELAVANQRANRKQTFNTVEQAEHFLKLAQRYAKHRGWTVRGQVQGTVVVYRVKPQEVRTRG